LGSTWEAKSRKSRNSAWNTQHRIGSKLVSLAHQSDIAFSLHYSGEVQADLIDGRAQLWAAVNPTSSAGPQLALQGNLGRAPLQACHPS
jgi:hypothetical protein